MTINGNIKCFEPSKALFKNGDTVAVSSGSSSKDNLIDFDKFTRWESDGSDDSTTETITITFNTSTTISRLLILNHNFKSYTVTPVTTNYILDGDLQPILDNSNDEIENDGGGISFINVTSLYSSTPVEGLSETDYSIKNSYYEFTPIYCSGIVISVTEAQETNDVPNQEKYCYRIVPTSEVDDDNGTFELYPELQQMTDIVSNTNLDPNRVPKIRKLSPLFVCTIAVNTTNNQADVDLFQHLSDRIDDFILWPNGGILTPHEGDTTNFRFNSRPYGLGDIFQGQIDKSVLPSYVSNIYVNPVSMTLAFRQTVR